MDIPEIITHYDSRYFPIRQWSDLQIPVSIIQRSHGNFKIILIMKQPDVTTVEHNSLHCTPSFKPNYVHIKNRY